MRRRGITGLVALAALLGSTTIGASASSGETDEAQSAQTEEGRMATQHIADEHGLSDQQARNYLSEQGEFNHFYTDLKAAYDERVFDAYILPPSAAQHFHVRSADPGVAQAVEDFTAETGIPVELENSPAFRAELTDAAANNLDQVSAVSEDEIQGFYVDPATGEVVLDVSLEGEPRTQEQLQEDVEFQGAPELTDTPVRTNLRAEPGSDHQARGGAATTSCTTGFTAESTQGTQGFWTAAHGNCGTSQTVHSGVSSESSEVGVSTVQATVYNSNADISYHSLPASVTVNATYWGASASNPIANGNTVTVAGGAHICTRGQTSGVRCGVAAVNYAPTYDDACPDGPCNSVFIMADGAGRDVGDSGGPWWFDEGEAVGIHKGGGDTWSVLSAIEFVPSGTSLR